jgi:hypothetical protein
MEIYLAAVVSFYLKPRRRLWQADGIQSLVEITVPKVAEIQRAKNLTQSEAEQRLSYLANIVDSGGWAIRGVSAPEATNAMQNDVFFEAQQAEDILATDGGVARSFDSMITQSDQRHRQEVLSRMHQPQEVTPAIPQPVTQVTAPPLADPYASLAPVFQPAQPAPVVDQTIDTSQVSFNPYPSAMHQSVVTPFSQQPAIAPQSPTQQPVMQAPPITQPEPITTSEKVTSPGIINLANNPDLSIATIAHEANRIHRQEQDSETEVVISLR